MRILIADDHALFRDSLRSLLESQDIEVVGEAKNGQEAIDLSWESKPDVVLMDLTMPEMDGLEATKRIAAELPEVKVVILTASDEDSNLFEAIKSGAKGYLLKDLESAQFFSLLEGVERGEPALTPSVARKLLDEFARPKKPAKEEYDPDALTDREREVLELMVQGTTSNRRLAKHLGVSENTVKFHLQRIYQRLGVNNRTEASRWYLEQGLNRPLSS